MKIDIFLYYTTLFLLLIMAGFFQFSGNDFLYTASWFIIGLVCIFSVPCIFTIFKKKKK